MGRRKALPPDFDGNYTEDMLSERQRNILKFVRTFINHKAIRLLYAKSVQQ